jgi:hypothetical protein
MTGFFDRLFKRSPPEDWRLVHTAEIGWVRNATQEKGKVYLHMFESDKGNRYITMLSPDVVSTVAKTRITAKNYVDVLEHLSQIKTIRNRDSVSICQFVLTHEDWNEKVYPWLCGRMNPKIPTYGEVPKKEFIQQLANKATP